MPVDVKIETEAPSGQLGGWMESMRAGINEFEAGQQPAPKKEESNGQGTGAAAAQPPAAGAAAKPAEPAAQPAVESKVAEAAKPAAAAAKPEEGEEKWPRTSDDWTKFKAKHKEREEALKTEAATRAAKIAELEKQLTELQAKAGQAPELPPEVKEQLEFLKKENEDYSNRLQVLEVTQHPKFQKYFKDKTDAQLALAKRIVGAELAESVEKALALPDSPEFAELKAVQLEEIVGALNPLQQSRFGSVLNALEEIKAERDSEIAKSKEHREQLYAKQAEAQKAAVGGQEQLFGNVAKKLQSKDGGFAAVQPKDGDDAWNAAVAQRIERAKNLLFGKNVTPEEVATAAIHAASMPAILEAYQSDMAERDKEITTLRAQVKALQAAQPNAGGGGGGGQGGGEGGGPTPKAGDDPFTLARKFAQGVAEAWKAS